MELERSTGRAARTTLVGLVGFGIAGLLLIVGTFLPWVVQPGVNIEESAAAPFRGGSQVRSYSGWQLEKRCGQSAGLASCSVPDKSFEGRTELLTGVWSLLVGSIAAILTMALTLALITRKTGLVWWLLACCWLISIVAVALATYTLLVVIGHLPPAAEVAPNGSPTPGPSPLRGGLILVLLASTLTLAGTAVATYGRRKTSPIPSS